MKSDLIKILDVLFDQPEHEPDLSAIRNIAATTYHPITLMGEVVRLMWLDANRPDEFDKEVAALHE